ncbi:MAG TPA: hypothetical protein VMY06_05225, partial [Sedimentisphaerales bacterium]|nr:hypothetical protein [Sedimentisphaerales bacterium]
RYFQNLKDTKFFLHCRAFSKNQPFFPEKHRTRPRSISNLVKLYAIQAKNQEQIRKNMATL